MTNIDKIEQLREICGKATPGPWSLPDKTVQESPQDWLYCDYLWTAHGGILSEYKHKTGAPKPDWEYIATFNPALVSKLLDVVEAGDELFVVLAHTKGHWETVQQYRKARKALEEAGGE